MAKRKKKENMVEDVELFDVVEPVEEEVLEMEPEAEEIMEEVIEEAIEEPKKESDGKVRVMVTDQFVKLEGEIHPRHTKLEICKKLADRAKRCKVL